ncbi:ABC transporter substrate-binding protein [Saccharibacter floricola]|nr:ABC transporter substrate-binding protein [Saccharibacter floricola]
MSDRASVSRRALLLSSLGGMAFFGGGRALHAAAMGEDGMQCQAVGSGKVPPIPGAPRKLTIAWNEDSICTSAVPVAKEKGFFKKYNLDVDYVNFAGSTDQLLETLSTGKADGAPGMALRWLKPLQQGFAVKLVAGLHAGCIYLMTSQKSGVKSLADLKGKTVGVADIGGPDRNFFAIRLKEAGVDPEEDVQWRQFPSDLLPIALQRGDVQAIANDDPVAYLQRRQFNLFDLDSNMAGEWANHACCVIGLREKLVKEEPHVAAAVASAILEAGAWIPCHPEEAAAVFQPFAPKVSQADLAQMLRMQGHHHQVIDGPFRDEVIRYAEALKGIGVFRPSFNTSRYADRVTQDLLG